MILTRNLHMFQDILEPKAENKNFSLKKTVSMIWSQILEKMALRWPRKIIKTIFLKSTKNMKLFTIFGGFRGLNDSSYHIFEDTFQ